ncbi:MAG: hypothetical protein RR383_09335 [Muribaculaceae bacterium]
MKNIEKMLRLTEAEMLELWKLKLKLYPVRKDCIIERNDGIDIGEYLLLQIREWYSKLLSDAPSQWLPCVDIATKLVITNENNGMKSVALPIDCVRPVEWKMSAWKRSVTEFISPSSPTAILQSNEYSRSRDENPIAILNGNEILLWASAGSTLTKAICVMRPNNEYYEFAEIALSTIM